jgi:hypothetical protein
MDPVTTPPAPATAPAPAVVVPTPTPAVVVPAPPPAPAVVVPPPVVEPPKAPPAPAHDGHDVMRRALVRSEVVRVAEKVGAIDADTVLALVADQFTVADDGRVVVSRDPRQTIEDHLRSYLASKPFLLKPLAPAGGSPASAVVVPPTAPAPVDLSTSAGLTDLARKTAVALGLRRAG